MEVAQALLKRRSIRKFTAEPVSAADVDALVHAAMAAPSACNSQPWEIYVVTKPALLEKFRTATPHTNMNAPLAFVICGNKNRYIENAPMFWVQDTSAATENLLLRVTDLGLGAVWCGIQPNPDKMAVVSDILQLPADHEPLNIIWVGHPAEERSARDWYNEDYVHILA